MSDATVRFDEELKMASAEVTGFTLSGKPDPGGAATVRLTAERNFALDQLGLVNQRVAAADAGPVQDRQATFGVRYAWRIVGQFLERAQAIDLWPLETLPPGGDGLEVLIRVREGVAIPPDVAALKSEVFAALNIARSVIDDRRKRVGQFQKQAKLALLDSLWAKYLRDIEGIVQVGLMTAEPSHVSFARSELAAFKSQFTLSEAGKVKNDYVKTLLVWAGFAAALFTGTYWVTREWVGPGAPGSFQATFYNLRNFHLLAAGTAVGTWLSFSLRRQELSFEDLAVLEPDRLEPWVRVVYMVVLATMVGLLLSTGAVVFGVGAVNGLAALHVHGTWALLIGMLAGVAERTLGSSVAARASEFSGAIGGAKSATKVNV